MRSRRRKGGGDLPPPGTTRWVASRKAAVVHAVETGRITAEWAIDAYDLTSEELATWREALATHGQAALRTTRIGDYRQQPDSPRDAT